MKNPKRIKAFIVAVLLCFSTFAFAACGDKDDSSKKDTGVSDSVSDSSNEDTTYTVTINGTKTTTQEIEAGKPVSEPTKTPTKSGYKFAGWFLEGSSTEYDWSTPVTGNITISAKWEEINIKVPSGVVVTDEEGNYSSGAKNTLIQLDEEFTEGSLTAKVKPVAAGGDPAASNDCGVIFGVEETAGEVWFEENNYFTVLVNWDGYVILARIDRSGTPWNPIAESDKLRASYDVNHEYEIKVQYKDGMCVVTVDGEKLIEAEIGELKGSGVGYRAAGIGTVFGEIAVDAEDVPVIEEKPVEPETPDLPETPSTSVEVEGTVIANDTFTGVNGSVEASAEQIKATAANSIAVCEQTASGNYTVTTKMKAGAMGDNGIVFALSDNGKTTYWEDGVSYYFFFINGGGAAHLGKVSNGWANCGDQTAVTGYNSANEYTLKVEVKDGTINCYVDGTLYVSFKDSAPLGGDKIGVRAGIANTTFKDFTVAQA